MTEGRRGCGRRVAIALAVLGALWALGAAGLSFVERSIHRRLVREAADRGIGLSISSVDLSLLGRLTLDGVEAAPVPRRAGAEAALRARLVEALVTPRLGSPRTWLCFRTRGLVVTLPEGLSAAIDDRLWRILELSEGSVSIEQRDGAALLRVRLERSGGPSRQQSERLDARFERYGLGRLVALSRRGEPLIEFGRLDGVASVIRSGAGFVIEGHASGKALRLSTLDEADAKTFGAPMDYDASISARLSPAHGRAEIACWSLATSGVVMSGAGSVEAGADDIWADVSVDVPRVEIASVLAASGLPISGLFGAPADATLRGGAASPPAPGAAAANPGVLDLGWASLTATFRGHLRDPDSIEVDEKLEYRPPEGGVPQMRYLWGPFTHVAVRPDGETRVEVRPGTPGFIALSDVPPLFVRALTIAEDAAFWGHPGIDLKEIPVALATNWIRGERARGASTITQQLVKNLFLSRQKSYGRKLQEVALTLLLESVLSKGRILEIYLNVIEWGPNLYGLRPAARHYFAKEPAELTPKEMAFLVCLIPGPIKYQRSIAGGVLTPRFHALVVSLLAKLRSVGALTDEEYETAKAEGLALKRPGDRPSATAPEDESDDFMGPLDETEGPPEPEKPAGEPPAEQTPLAQTPPAETAVPAAETPPPAPTPTEPPAPRPRAS